MQATYWQAQLTDGSKLRGGQQNLFIYDVNVSAVPIDQMKLFSVVHNTYTWTYYVPTKTWYKDGKSAPFAYPAEFIMGDGSLLTVNKNVSTDLLELTQIY